VIVVDGAIAYGDALNKRMGDSCHMCSDLVGAEGTAELVAFAKRIGMREKWLQRPGTRHEHFDLFGARRGRAVAAGAREVTRSEMVAIWRTKRAAGML
jgi:hypothetical protein